MSPRLSHEELLRYSRQLLLPDFDGATQMRLREAKVLVVGAGGLGSPVLYYLAAAGIGTLGIVDDDIVDCTNLQRQIMYTTADVGRPKVVSAAETIDALNSNVSVVTHRVRLNKSNVLSLIADYDAIVDGVDNFTSRFLLNDACVMSRKIMVEGGILDYAGLVMGIKGGETACYRCAFDQTPPDDAMPGTRETGVLGAVAGVTGALQAVEVIKVLTGVGEPLYNRVVQFHALRGEFHSIDIARRKECPACGQSSTDKLLEERDLSATRDERLGE